MAFEQLPPVEFREVSYTKSDWVARITIDRPGAYNAYSTRSLIELAAAFRQAAFDDEVGVIVMTGSGTSAFCSGGDVKEYEQLYTKSPHDYWKYMGLFSGYIESILNSGKPVIARVNGMAVGGGNESHLACDLSVIAEHAYVGQVGTRVGSVAAGGGTQWLPLFVGDRRARWMLMLNRPVPAYQALEWGLVNEVVPSVKKDGEFVVHATPEQIGLAKKGADGYSIDLAKLDETVDELCAALLETFPECTRYTKQQTNFWKDLAWHQTVGHARLAHSSLRQLRAYRGNGGVRGEAPARLSNAAGASCKRPVIGVRLGSLRPAMWSVWGAIPAERVLVLRTVWQQARGRARRRNAKGLSDGRYACARRVREPVAQGSVRVLP